MRPIVLVGVLLVAPFWSAPVLAADPPVNLVPNPSFEVEGEDLDLVPDGWSVARRTTGTAFQTDLDSSHGSYSLALVAATRDIDPVFVRSDLFPAPVCGFGTPTLTFRFETDVHMGRIGGAVEYWNAFGEWIRSDVIEQGVTSAWVARTKTMAPPAGATDASISFAPYSSSLTSALVDQVRLSYTCPTPPPPAACADGVDNDGDGAIDFPADPGCTSSSDNDETNPPPPPAAACADGQDNDWDGAIDFPADPGCTSSLDNDETNPPPPGRWSEDWEDGLAGWFQEAGSGASGDCTKGSPGCSLHMAPPCCPGSHSMLTQNVAIPLTPATAFETKFLGSSTGGSTDTIIQVRFDTGYVNLELTGPSEGGGNTRAAVFTEQGGFAVAGSWGSSNVWYRANVSIDVSTQTTWLRLYTPSGALIGASPAIPFSGSVITGISIQSAQWSPSSTTHNYDTLRVW